MGLYYCLIVEGWLAAAAGSAVAMPRSMSVACCATACECTNMVAERVHIMLLGSLVTIMRLASILVVICLAHAVSAIAHTLKHGTKSSMHPGCTVGQQTSVLPVTNVTGSSSDKQTNKNINKQSSVVHSGVSTSCLWLVSSHKCSTPYQPVESAVQ